MLDISRYKNVPDPAVQLQFLELQLFLLDDFRIRLTQVRLQCVLALFRFGAQRHF